MPPKADETNGRWDLVYELLREIRSEQQQVREDITQIKIGIAETRGRSGIWGTLDRKSVV